MPLFLSLSRCTADTALGGRVGLDPINVYVWKGRAADATPTPPVVAVRLQRLNVAQAAAAKLTEGGAPEGVEAFFVMRAGEVGAGLQSPLGRFPMGSWG